MNKEEELIQLLRERNYTFSSAESCTGGMLMSTLINVSGASSVIKEGFITYANEAKMKYLGVKKETLDQYTAVSEQTAYEMAYGLIAQTGAQVTASITGIAGPDGGTEETPVGTVFVGCSVCNHVYVKRLKLHGDRLSIRTQAVSYAIDFVIECINL
ncbi:MAG: CinA family protein [Clostridiales bacterium]|nr:CinA family protein [Clostridiales bacterium]